MLFHRPLTPFVTIIVIAVVLLCPEVIEFTVSSAVVQQTFKTLLSKQFPPDLTQHGSAQAVRNLISCATLCARHSTCKAIYLKAVDLSNPLCYMYENQVPDLHFLTPGTGTYGYFTGFSTSATPQSLSSGSMLYTTWYEPEQTLVAVYSFSNLKSLSVLFDRDTNEFPQLSTVCAQTVNQVRGLASTMVRIHEASDSSFHFHVICKDGETKQGDVTCDSNGNWVTPGNYGVACLSQQCYRVSDSGYAQYNGQYHKTRYGTGCSQWSNYYYYSDSKFYFDGYSKANAQNYCRDINRLGRPWCKIGSYYDYCGVSKCNWRP